MPRLQLSRSTRKYGVHVCDTAERGDQWVELCQVAVVAVAHYIQAHGRQMSVVTLD